MVFPLDAHLVRNDGIPLLLRIKISYYVLERGSLIEYFKPLLRILTKLRSPKDFLLHLLLFLFRLLPPLPEERVGMGMLPLKEWPQRVAD